MQVALGLRGVPAVVTVAWDGPQIEAYKVELPLGLGANKLHRSADVLARAAQAPYCRISPGENGSAIVEVPKPESERKVLRASRMLAEYGRPPTATAVALGIATGGYKLWVDIADNASCHVMLAGTTGSGKTNLLHWWMIRLMAQNGPGRVAFVCVDPKATALNPFRNAAHLLHPPVSNPIEIAQVLAYVEQELDNRLAGGSRSTRLIVVVEEMADLLAVNQDLAKPLARIAQVGRDQNVHLLATVQHPNAESVGKALINFKLRVVGLVTAANRVVSATGQAKTYAHQLLGAGDMLAIRGPDVIRIQVPFVEPHDFEAVAKLAQPRSLQDVLPTAARFADELRDARGGRGRRTIGSAEYQEIEQEVRQGATADDLAGRHQIGVTRAMRIIGGTRGES